MRWIVALCLSLSLLALPGVADEVILVDGRRVRGRVVEKGDRIEVHHKFGVLTFERSEVVRIVPEKDAPPPAAAVAPERPVHANPVLGYRVTLPEGDWGFHRQPPFPLVDLVVTSSRHGSQVVVAVDRPVDPIVPAPSLAGAVDLVARWRRVLEVDHRALGEFAERFEMFAGVPSYRFDVLGTELAGEGRFRMTRRHLVVDGLEFTIDARRPTGSPPEVVRALEAAVDSFELYEPVERDGDLYTPTGQFFQLTLGPKWWCAAVDAGAGRVFRVAGPDDAYLEIDVRPAGGGDLDAGRAAEAIDDFLAPLSVRRRGRIGPVNEKRAVVFHAEYETGDVKGEVWALVREGRLYRIRAEGPSGTMARFEARKVYRSMDILPDYSTDLAAERKAIEACLDGRHLYNADRLPEARERFERAIELSSRDSTSNNYLGMIAFRGEDYEAAVRSFRAAHHLFPSSMAIQLNLGNSHLWAAHAALAARPRDYALARHHLDESKVLVDRFGDQLGGQAAVAYSAIGLAALDEKRYTQAIADLTRARDLDDRLIHRHNLALAHYSEASDAAAAGRLERARQKLRQALEVNPDFPEAQAALESIGG